MAPQILLPALVVLMGLAGGLPQLAKARRTHGLGRAAALATAGFSLGVSALVVAGLLARGGPPPGGPLVPVLMLGAIAAWTCGLIWGGPPTRHDRMVFWLVGALVAAFVGSVLALAVRSG